MGYINYYKYSDVTCIDRYIVNKHDIKPITHTGSPIVKVAPPDPLKLDYTNVKLIFY